MYQKSSFKFFDYLFYNRIKTGTIYKPMRCITEKGIAQWHKTHIPLQK